MKKEHNITRFLPTLLSLMALCFGVSAIKMSYAGSFATAVSFILIACFLDGIDGRVARFFNVSSGFGEQIDSLADLVNFGIAPAFILYCWKLNEIDINGIAWFAVLLQACCMTIRLARFNSTLSTRGPSNDPAIKYFFQGIPAPASAGLLILPLVLSFQFGYGFYTNPNLVLISSIIISILTGSTIPTPSLKKIKIKENYKYLFLIVFIMLTALLISKPWFALSIVGIAYIFSIIIGFFVYIKFKKQKKVC